MSKRIVVPSDEGVEKPLSRRAFCSLAAAAVAEVGFGHRSFAAVDSAPVTIAVDLQKAHSRVPDDFMGLSYESGQLASPSFFSPANHSLIDIFRGLSPIGVLRLGGNLSAYTRWSFDEQGDDQAKPNTAVAPDAGSGGHTPYTITPTAIRNLRGFLDACNWNCIYGLNLEEGSLENALAEGKAVSETLGSRLLYVQFGNEPDLFKHHAHPDAPWTYEEYSARWMTFRAAFDQQLPNVKVAGPDISNQIAWLQRFAAEHGRQVSLLSSHFYAGGPPSDPTLTPESLLRPGERFDKECRQALVAAHAAGIPHRFTEVNSCYNGGKPGVSDVFSSALWAADFCLSVASLGCTGVNLHGGANGFYTPIAGSEQEGFALRPEFYGLCFVQRLAGNTLYSARMDTGGRNVTGYAAGEAGRITRLAIINKDPASIRANITGLGLVKLAHVLRLSSTSLASKQPITFSGLEVARDGSFHVKAGSRKHIEAGNIVVQLHPYSAALLEME